MCVCVCVLLNQKADDVQFVYKHLSIKFVEKMKFLPQIAPAL